MSTGADGRPVTGSAARVVVRRGRRARSLDLVLARADRSNAIDMAFAGSLRSAAEQVRAAVGAQDVDCVVISAQGRHFCVGGDLADFPMDPEKAVSHMHAMSVQVHEAMAIFLELPVPIVTRVHGVAAGAGVGLAVFGDIVVASNTARFLAAYSAVGLSPDCGTSWLLPRLIGERRAMDMVLTNRSVSATEAQQWQLVSRTVSPDRLDEEVDGVVAAVLAAGRDAAIAGKRLLRSAQTDGLRAHLADEGQTIAQLGGSDHARATREKFFNPPQAIGSTAGPGPARPGLPDRRTP